MNLTFHRTPSYLLVRVSGDLDLSCAQVFRERLEGEWKRTGIPNIILNLRGLSFIDSTGLAVLLGRKRQVVASGGRFLICEVSPKIYSMFELAGLLSALEVVRTQDEAIAILTRSGGDRGGGDR